MLVERDTEIARLRTAVQGERIGVLVAVTGPPGIGKSSLLRELAAEAQRDGVVVLAAVGTRIGTGVAHGILHQLFLSLARAAGPGGAPFDGPGAVLQELVLRGQVPADGVAIAYAVHWTLSSLARTGRVLLIVDDAQWADPVSATVIAQVAALLSSDPVSIVLGVREAPRETGGSAGELVAMAGTVIRPRPLSARGIAELIGAGPAESERVRELSGGIPFYIAELAGLLAAGEELGPPPRVIESVMSRLEALGPTALAVARAVCVLGPEAGPSAVGRLAGVSEVELDQLARTLVAEGILGAETGEPMLQSAHPLVADAVLAGTGAVGLAGLRAAAADLLHDMGTPAPRVAAQLLLTEPGQQPWRVSVLREAAEEAMASGAFGGAVDLLERALLERAVGDRNRSEILGLLGGAYFGVGDGSAAAAAWRKGLEYLEPAEQGMRMVDIGDALYLSADYSAAEEAYRAGVELLDRAGLDRASAPALDSAARYATARLTVEPMAEAVSVEVLRTVLARPSDGREERRFLATAAVSAHTRQEWSLEPGMLAERAYGRGAFAVEGFADDPTTYLLSGSLYLAGRYGDALDLLGRAVEDARGRNRLASEVSARGVRGPIRMLSGDLRAGIDDLEVAVNLGRLRSVAVPGARLGPPHQVLDCGGGAGRRGRRRAEPRAPRAARRSRARSGLLGRAEHARRYRRPGGGDAARRGVASARPRGRLCLDVQLARGCSPRAALELGRSRTRRRAERRGARAARAPSDTPARPSGRRAAAARRLIEPTDARAALEAYFDSLRPSTAGSVPGSPSGSRSSRSAAGELDGRAGPPPARARLRESSRGSSRSSAAHGWPSSR